MKDGLLGDTIRQARMDNKMTQEQLAEAINISPTHMKHIESEHRKPSVDVLFSLADEFFHGCHAYGNAVYRSCKTCK
jgi:transcriptional regulator with XRE-family HTH domain